MALLSRYSRVGTRHPRHWIAIPQLPQWKQPSENHSKILRAIKRSDQKLLPFWADTQGWRPDILITQRFHSLPNENSHWKPMQKFERDPTVGPKVMALFSRCSCSVDQTSLSLSRHFVYIPRKTASRNPCKNLSVIQRSDKLLWPFWAYTQG
jgi:hypothetical protein